MESLRAMLHQRGINRLAKALYGHNPTLIWHVSHHLDAERGSMLLKLLSPLDHPSAGELLAAQVVDLILAMKNHNSE